MNARTAVVFVHGLWLTGVESTLLRRRVGADVHCSTHAFKYPSVTASMAEINRRLGEFISGLGASSVHLVGHSLGGIVVLRFLEERTDLPPGRAVLLGAPVHGSRAAEGVARWPLGKAILGQNIAAEVLTSHTRRWDGRRELGIIAGDLSRGLGRLFGDLDGTNDGTVSVSETELPGATDRIVMPVSHTGMLFSIEVAHQTARFLASGSFAR